MTGQLASTVIAAAQGHGRHIPLIILGALAVIAAAALCYAWHRRALTPKTLAPRKPHNAWSL